jgi:hypothetical protein
MTYNVLIHTSTVLIDCGKDFQGTSRFLTLAELELILDDKLRHWNGFRSLVCGKSMQVNLEPLLGNVLMFC